MQELILGETEINNGEFTKMEITPELVCSLYLS